MNAVEGIPLGELEMVVDNKSVTKRDWYILNKVLHFVSCGPRFAYVYEIHPSAVKKLDYVFSFSAEESWQGDDYCHKSTDCFVVMK